MIRVKPLRHVTAVSLSVVIRIWLRGFGAVPRELVGVGRRETVGKRWIYEVSEDSLEMKQITLCASS